MIGVIANPLQHSAVREFFELFKTPWEFYRKNRDYEILICADDVAVQNSSAKLVAIYAGHEVQFDVASNVRITAKRAGPRTFLGQGMRIPIYGDSVTFAFNDTRILLDEKAEQTGAYAAAPMNGTTVVRVGYDLFDEVTCLLSEGQPSTNASIPSLEFHISVLRNMIVGSGLTLVEIPPAPEGYRFIACLTHDVDHPSIRKHKFDHTMFGFLYRAVVGSLLAGLRGRASMRTIWTNWAAALKLPFVYLGLAKDFWNQFETYSKLEGHARSSYFVIPFKGRRGAAGEIPAPIRRASGYGAADIATEVRQLLSEGHEVGLHGIDAWHDSSKGREEIEEIRRITGVQELGVRMHWLYFDQRSPALLEHLGVDYDSTVGYNEAVGYRAGTTQVYKPLEVARLLELPLHIMDTALFLPGRQNLSSSQASKLVAAILDNADQLGGVVTINWHDRSIAPERLWRDFYVTLIEELNRRGAWLATASETVQWFRKRRMAAFGESESGAQLLNAPVHTGDGLPGLGIRVHNAKVSQPRTHDRGCGNDPGFSRAEAPRCWSQSLSQVRAERPELKFKA